MGWIADTCCVIDLAQSCPRFGQLSAEFLEEKRSDELAGCPVTLIEIMPQFDGDFEAAHSFLIQADIDPDLEWIHADTRQAGFASAVCVGMK